MSTSEFTVHSATVQSHNPDDSVNVIVPSLSGLGVIRMEKPPTGLIAPSVGASTLIAVNHDRTKFEWIGLPSTGTGGGTPGEDALADHIIDPAPHPAYDVDIPSLSALFESGLI